MKKIVLLTGLLIASSITFSGNAIAGNKKEAIEKIKKELIQIDSGNGDSQLTVNSVKNILKNNGYTSIPDEDISAYGGATLLDEKGGVIDTNQISNEATFCPNDNKSKDRSNCIHYVEKISTKTEINVE